MFLLTLLVSLSLHSTQAIQCWQCAQVDHLFCPENAKLVESAKHDACITWILGNGTVVLQNVVQYETECTPSKIDFWNRFLDSYYSSQGGGVNCCTIDGCNRGTFADNFFKNPSGMQGSGAPANTIPGAPLIFGAVSTAPQNFPPTTPMPVLVQQQNGALPQLLNSNLGNFAFVNTNNGFTPPRQNQPPIISTRQQSFNQGSGLNFGSSNFIPSSNQVAFAATLQNSGVDLNGFTGFTQSGQ